MTQAEQIQSKTANEVRNLAVDFTDKLDSGEALTGTPTVTSSPSGLTISSVDTNAGALTILGTTVAIGRAVTCSVSGGSSGTRYTVAVQCGTDATVAQTLEVSCLLDVE
tara:strand:- start:148 stop:474 length:327 start_codon:yes stop_codon:yes gene_type:complete